jgi:hypothetical protein
MKANFAVTEVAWQSADKLTAKNLSEHRDGKKEATVRWNPMRVIEGQSAGRDYTMGMRVMFEFLIPGVEHTEEADFGAKMLGITSDFEEGFGASLQQQMVQDFLVLQGEWGQLMGQGEDNMDVARREKLLTTRLEPSLAGVGLTLWAVPVPAAVVRDDRTVAAVGALIEMPAQGGGATAHDGSQHFEVLPGDPPAAAFDEAASRGANQIGHLERWPVHLFALRYLLFQLERVQRTRGGVEMPLGEMEIDGGFFQIVMSQEQLNGAQVSSVF